MKYQVLINPSEPYYMALVGESEFFDYYKDVTPFIESCYDSAVRTVQSAFPDMPVPTKEQYAGCCDVYQMRTYDNDTLQANYTVTVKDGKFKLVKDCKECKSSISSREELIDEWFDNEFEGIMTMDIYKQLMALVDPHLYSYYFNKLQRYDWEPISWHYALLNTYTMDGYGHHDAYKEWFSTFEPDYLTGEEREQYDALPDKVTVYRGCNVEEAENGIEGLSWTTDFRTALFFAYRYGTDGRCVVKAEVDKDRIKAFVNNRKESECIIIAPVEYEIFNL